MKSKHIKKVKVVLTKEELKREAKSVGKLNKLQQNDIVDLYSRGMSKDDILAALNSVEYLKANRTKEAKKTDVKSFTKYLKKRKDIRQRRLFRRRFGIKNDKPWKASDWHARVTLLVKGNIGFKQFMKDVRDS